MPDFSLPRYINLSARIRGEHRDRLSDCARYEDLYNKIHWYSTPEEGDFQVTLPIHTQTVDTVHAILTGFPPTITVYPNRSGSQRDSDTADNVERWHLAVDQENTWRMGRDEWGQGVFDQTLYGIGVVREVYPVPAWWIRGDPQPDDAEPTLIVQQGIPPVQFYFDMGNPPRGRFRLCFYDMDMSVGDIEDTYGVTLTLRTNDDGDLMEKTFDEIRSVVDWWEWIGKDIYHCIYVNVRDPKDNEQMGQFIKQPTIMPEYWMLPYHVFFFRDTGSRDYRRMGLSVLFTIDEIVHDFEILASRQMAVFEKFADPQILAERGLNGGDSPIQIDKSPGSVIDLVQGDRVSYLTWPGSPPDIRYLMEKFEAITSELSFSKGLLEQGADTTGFRAALDRDTSLLKISKGLRNYELARAQLYVARAYAMSKLSPDRKLPARGISRDNKRYSVAMTGKTIGEYRDIVVEIKPRFPGDLARELNTANQAIASKIWDTDTGMEYVGVQDKSKMKDGIIQDQIEFNPLVIQAQAQRHIQQLQKQWQEEDAAKGGGAPTSMTDQILAQHGPPPGMPGLPGTEGSPGQPAGASPESGQTAGLDNRLLAGQQITPPGTVTPAGVTASPPQLPTGPV